MLFLYILTLDNSILIHNRRHITTWLALRVAVCCLAVWKAGAVVGRFRRTLDNVTSLGSYIELQIILNDEHILPCP